MKRSRNNDRLGVPDKRKAEMGEEAGVNLIGDYEQRMEGMSPEGKLARFE